MRGFSTIEIMIAIGVITLAVASSVVLSGGTHDSLRGSDDAQAALTYAQSILRREASRASEDFDAIAATTSTSGTYTSTLSVEPATADPYNGKTITVRVSWSDEYDRAHQISLTSLVARTIGTISNDECTAGDSGEWAHPHAASLAMLSGMLLPASAPPGHTFSSTNPLAALDTHRGILVAALASTSVKTNDALFLFDISNPTLSPRYIGGIDPNPSGTDGINAIVVAGRYAYAASAHDANFKTCKPGSNCAQLHIIDISNPANPIVVVNYLLATSSAPAVLGNMTSSGQAIGRALYYQNGYLFFGLSKTASGPEFNILDVHDPLHPLWVGGYQVGASINQIVVRTGYAYLATDDKSREAIVLDVHDVAHPTLAASFDPRGTLGYEVGESVGFVGDVLFAGMSFSFGFSELYALDQSSFPSISTRGATPIGASVMKIIAEGSHIFLVTSTSRQFQVRDGSIPSTLPLISQLSLPGIGVALGCEGNTLFAASNTGGQGNLSIITPGS